jgi:hypothetical protein
MTREELDNYVESIGGLINGWYPDKDPIMQCPCSIGEGWHQLVHDLMVELLEAGWNRHIKQIKEKFGGLRFYTGVADEKIWDIISRYEKLSYTICEKCGEPGELRKDGGNYGGWWQTLCDKHYDEIKEIQKQNGR